MHAGSVCMAGSEWAWQGAQLLNDRPVCSKQASGLILQASKWLEPAPVCGVTCKHSLLAALAAADLEGLHKAHDVVAAGLQVRGAYVHPRALVAQQGTEVGLTQSA